ncbi:hypothetical protein D3C85_909850 [compost metagenome]
MINEPYSPSTTSRGPTREKVPLLLAVPVLMPVMICSSLVSTSRSLRSTSPDGSWPGVVLAVPPASMARAKSGSARGVSSVPWMVMVSTAVLVAPARSRMV